MSKKALITGITGQDGSYLAELLCSLGYEVHGIVRRSSSFNTGRIDHLYKSGLVKLWYGDLTDFASLVRIISEVKPNEVYNLGAQSQVRTSFDIPISTVEIDALGTLNLLEAIRLVGWEKWGTKFYRDAYGMFICNGILFNHESPRRGKTFVTRKITRAATRIKLGLQDKLELGNLDALRDWGFAGDYVCAMFLMMQKEFPEDYVIATGETHSVEEFLNVAFGMLDLDWKDHVVINAKYCRPTEVNELCGDASKARSELNWTPLIGFNGLVSHMIASDLELAKKECGK